MSVFWNNQRSESFFFLIRILLVQFVLVQMLFEPIKLPMEWQIIQCFNHELILNLVYLLYEMMIIKLNSL